MNDWYPSLRSDVVADLVDGELVVLDRKNERVHQLNPIATFIVNYFDGRHTLEQVRRAILEEFDVDERRAETELTELVEQLKKLDLLA